MLNLSLGGIGACSATMLAAFDTARAKGALILTSAGNDNVDASTYQPSNCRGTVTVEATNKLGGRSDYSNDGEGPHLVGPGGATNRAIVPIARRSTAASVDPVTVPASRRGAHPELEGLRREGSHVQTFPRSCQPPEDRRP